MKRAALIALAFLGACASTETGGGDGSSSVELRGGAWMMLNETRSATPPTIEFGVGRASGYAGCNRWLSSTGWRNQEMGFGEVSTTRMMCSPASMEAERAFIAVLNRTSGYRIENGELVLTDNGGADLARFRRTN